MMLLVIRGSHCFCPKLHFLAGYSSRAQKENSLGKHPRSGTTLEEDRTLLAFFSRAAHRLLSQIYHS